MIHHGDLFDVLPTLPAESIDSGVMDPPYGIGFMGKQWDTFKPGETERKVVANTEIDSDNPNLKNRKRRPATSPSNVEYDRSLMGQRAFQEWTERWAREVFRVLKPGAHLLVCGAPRSYHRMASGLEDAGFEVRDTLAWVTGQGFPKSLNFSDGWGTGLKPGWESVTVARKPLSFTQNQRIIVANLLQLEARLWTLCARDAGELSASSRSELDAAFASARWTADDRSNTLAALSGLTDTSRFESALRTSLNIVSSWNDTLADLLRRASTSTTRTNASPTIDWTTLKSCSSVLTPHDIIRAVIRTPGYGFDAAPAARYLTVALRSISDTLELSALERVMSPALINYRDAADLDIPDNLECFIVARKPLAGTVKANRDKFGTGAINVDGCRVGTGGQLRWSEPRDMGYHGGTDSKGIASESDLGRWPANVAFDEQAAAMLDDQSGELVSGAESSDGHIRRSDADRRVLGGFKGQGRGDFAGALYGDSGGASRFFYVAKPSRSERDQGCETLTPKQRDDSRKEGNPGGDNPRNRGLQPRGNHHPTVKPIELMRWLVRLVTPADGIVLDPFTGSGTTGCACAYELKQFIGIEREAEYVEIAKRRIASCAPLFTETA